MLGLRPALIYDSLAGELRGSAASIVSRDTCLHRSHTHRSRSSSARFSASDSSRAGCSASAPSPAGARLLRRCLAQEGIAVGRRHVRTLMRGLPARLRLRLARDDPDRPLPHLLQQPPSPQPIERPKPPTKPTAPPSHSLALPNHSPVASRYLPRLRLYRKTGPLLPRDRSMATALRRESRSPLGR